MESHNIYLFITTIIPFHTVSNFVVVPARIEVRPIRQQAEVYWSNDADPDSKVILY